MTSHKKYIQAIIKVPIEVLDNGSYETHMNYTSVDFAPLDSLPLVKTSKEDILKRLRIIKDTVQQPQESILYDHSSDEEEDTNSDIESYRSDSSISSRTSISRLSENSSIESDDEDSTVGEDEIESLYDPTEESPPVLESPPQKPDDQINNLMDIFNLFIQPGEIVKKNKPKNISFKKKRHNNKRFTARTYGP